MKADKILFNFRLNLSFTSKKPDIFIAIKDDRVFFVGEKREISSFMNKHTEVINCEGHFLLPGFNDAHCHPFAFAISRLHVDCGNVTDIAAIQLKIRCHIQNSGLNPALDWVQAVNCDFSKIVNANQLTRFMLDEISLHFPIILFDRSGQRCLLNSLALKACGLNHDIIASPHAKLYIDEKSNTLTGMIEGNEPRILHTIPQANTSRINAAIRQVSDCFLSFGVTSVQDASWSNDLSHWCRTQELVNNGLFQPRITFMPGYDSLNLFINKNMTTGYGNDRLKIGAAKLALDESTGNPKPPPERLYHAAMFANNAGFQLAFHVPDIYMLKASLAALRFVKSSTTIRFRPRFEHCPVCPAGLMQYLKEFGVCVISQPEFLFEMGDKYISHLDSEQIQWVFPFQSFLRNGIGLAFSSDAPMCNINPLISIATAVRRQVNCGSQLNPSERISLDEAFASYSLCGAFSSHDETIKGQVKPGMLADLVLLSIPNLLSTDALPEECSVQATFIGGRLVWQKSMSTSGLTHRGAPY